MGHEVLPSGILLAYYEIDEDDEASDQPRPRARTPLPLIPWNISRQGRRPYELSITFRFLLNRPPLPLHVHFPVNQISPKVI